MTAAGLNTEFGHMRERFRRTLATSIALHAGLLLLLVTVRDLAPTAERIVEITWLDQPLPEAVETPPPAPEPVVRPAADPAPEQVAPALTVKEKLARAGSGADETRRRLRDLDPSPIREQLAALDAGAPDLTRAARGAMAPVVRNGPPRNLERGAAVREPAVALTRGPTTPSRAAAVVAERPAGGAGAGSGADPAAAAAEAVRDLGGATLKGLVADRRVVHHIMPVYPEWAMAQAVEATVTLHFVVLPDGAVKPGVRVEKTAGFQDFDTAAVAAIRQWRFAPLDGGEARDQWGTITFRYRLHD